MEIRTFRTEGGHEVKVTTRENFSSFRCQFFEAITGIPDIFSQFEEQLNLKITHWETLKGGSSGDCVIFRHEPKEKTGVAHLSEFEPDARL